MTQSLTKQEKLVLAGLLVCCIGVASFITNFQIISKTTTVVENVINYKMGKATEEISTYSLDGREIDRTIVKPEEEGFIAKTARKISQALGLKKDSKKTAAAKKAEDAKKAQAAQAKKMPKGDFSKPVAKAPVQKQAPVAKNDTEVQTQDFNNGGGYVAPTETPNQAAQPTEETKKVKKTLEQIKTEFMANPTREAMMALVSSYKKGEVNSADFYQLQSELLESENDTLVGHALYALRLTPSNESFSMMAQYQPSAKAAYQTYIEEALLAYNQSSQINVLGSVIRSGDKVVVMKALRVIEAGINSIKNGTVSQLVDGRGRRETTFAGFSLQNYLSLLPVITQALAASQDNELTASLELMKNLITDIRDSNTAVAAN